MSEKKATPENEAAFQESQLDFKPNDAGNDAAAQRRRALDMLRSGGKTTLELRRDGDILAPAARIKELRVKGYDILTQRVNRPTDSGKLHNVALYILMREVGAQA
jgi:hypothetical protein